MCGMQNKYLGGSTMSRWDSQLGQWENDSIQNITLRGIKTIYENTNDGQRCKDINFVVDNLLICIEFDKEIFGNCLYCIQNVRAASEYDSSILDSYGGALSIGAYIKLCFG